MWYIVAMVKRSVESNCCFHQVFDKQNEVSVFFFFWFTTNLESLPLNISTRIQSKHQYLVYWFCQIRTNSVYPIQKSF